MNSTKNTVSILYVPLDDVLIKLQFQNDILSCVLSSLQSLQQPNTQVVYRQFDRKVSFRWVPFQDHSDMWLFFTLYNK